MANIKRKIPSEKFNNLVSPSKEKNNNSRNMRGVTDIEVLNLNINNILPYSKQARQVFSEEDISGLADSIAEFGVINPIQVIKNEKQGFFNVINGERRLRAAKKAGLENVPSIIIENDSKTELISVVDNIQRQDLHPIELAEAISSLINNYGDKKEVSAKLGLSYTSVLENLKLLTLPSEVKEVLLNRDISSRTIFRKLLKQKNIEEMLEVINKKITKTKTDTKKRRLKVLDCYLVDGELEFDFNISKIDKVQIEKIINYLTETISK
jgi:ParB family chromosome partitioning protein